MSFKEGFRLGNFGAIFIILVSVGLTASEFNGSLGHFLIIFNVALLLGIIGGIEW